MIAANSYYLQPVQWATYGTTATSATTSFYASYVDPVAPRTPHVETELEWLDRRVREVSDLVAA